MLKLKEDFNGTGSQKGWCFTQLFRTDKVALYRKENEDGLMYYEVFKIRCKKDKEIFGKKIEAHEHYPSDNDFGEIAWCYGDSNKAKDKYIYLVEIEVDTLINN